MKWETYETCPKDGSEFLAYFDELEQYWIAEWDSDKNEIVESFQGGEIDVSHWMPLPVPPSNA